MESCDISIRGIHLDRSKKQIVYCTRGAESLEAAEALCERGYDAYFLVGGYHNWLVNSVVEEENAGNAAERRGEIEKSIRKKFHKQPFTPFARAINTYDMLQPGSCGGLYLRRQGFHAHGQAFPGAEETWKDTFRAVISCYGSGIFGG